MPKHVISSSDGYSLHFMTTEEYEEYEKDERELFWKHYNILKEKYGVYATNQGKYVDSVDDLNELDSKKLVSEGMNDLDWLRGHSG